MSEERLSHDEIMAKVADHRSRVKRDALLSESDWRVLPHSPSDVEAWATYRQQLRDLPADPAWPNVEFPTPPEGN